MSCQVIFLSTTADGVVRTDWMQCSQVPVPDTTRQSIKPAWPNQEILVFECHVLCVIYMMYRTRQGPSVSRSQSRSAPWKNEQSGPRGLLGPRVCGLV
jgi:hypothetical protein